MFKRIGIGFISALFIIILGCKDDDEVSHWEAYPELEDVSQSAGIIGSEVILTGHKLSKVNKVVFGSVEVENFTATETSITTSVPQGVLKGELNIAVYSPEGSDRIPFVVIFVPSISEISTSEAFPGEEVVITGEDMEEVTQVYFGDVPAEFTASTNSIVTAVPPDAPFGNLQLSIKNAGGSVQIPFKVNDDPIISSFLPTFGAVGDEIILNGINFIEVQSVTVGDVNAEFAVEDANSLKFVVPEGTATGYITVVTATGEGISQIQFVVQIGDAVPVLLYEEGLHSDWDDWGWNSNRDFQNSEQPKTGVNALKITHTGDGWGAVNFHSDPAFDLIGYEKLSFSVFGAPGSEGESQTLWIKDGSGVEHTKVQFVLKEGEYVLFEFTMDQLGNPPSILELFIQNNGVVGNEYYLDDFVLE